jgi:hypothetical protein
VVNDNNHNNSGSGIIIIISSSSSSSTSIIIILGRTARNKTEDSEIVDKTKHRRGRIPARYSY